MDDIKEELPVINDGEEQPTEPEEKDPVEVPEIPEVPAGSKLPRSNEEALAYRDAIVNGLIEDIPKVTDAVVEYIDELIRTRSSDGDPVVRVHAELLAKAYNRGDLYSDSDKNAIILDVCNKYAEQGYDVAEYRGETTLTPTVATYTITISKKTDKLFKKNSRQNC